MFASPFSSIRFRRTPLRWTLSRPTLSRWRSFTGLASVAALLALFSAGATAANPSPAPRVASGCDQACLTKVMDLYLEHLLQHKTEGVPLAADAVLRENTAPVKLGEGVWKLAKEIKGRQDYPDPVTSSIYSWIAIDLADGHLAQMSERIRVTNHKISEVETVINTGMGATPYPGGPYNHDNTLEQEIVFPAPIPAARRSSREDLIKIANGYFESLGMADATAARFGARCLRYESGSGGGFCGAVVGAAVLGAGGGRGGRGGDVAVTDPGAPGAPAATAAPAGRGPGRGGAQARQQTIERRFPVAIPDLGVVVGYMFIMHHERTPPQDNFINEIFKVVDGKIREIDAVGFQVTAPGRSGYPEDIPVPGILRAAPKEESAAPVAQAAPPPPQTDAPSPATPAAGRGRGGRGFGGPQVIPDFPKPPYPGITEVRDLAYGSDPKQRIDILAPSATADKPRPVVIFVHGGGWVGGDKRAPGDDLYENVILWAARHGMVGVNVNYRLADYANSRNVWPVQEQDLSAAVDWIAVNVAAYGGDPNRMFLWGHSAGGSAVAGFASNPAFYGNDPIVKGIFLLSAPIDPVLDEQSGRGVPYYGKTHQDFIDHGAVKTLPAIKIPVLLGYSSEETGLVPAQMDEAKKVLCDAGHCPRTVTTKGSHQGEMLAVGTADTSATDALLAFIASIP